MTKVKKATDAKPPGYKGLLRSYAAIKKRSA